MAAVEHELNELRTALEDPAVMSDAARLQVTCTRMEEAQHRVDALYARWAELEKKQS